MNALDISSVTFRYDGASAPALRDFSLTVADGQMHALLGPNGAGKSTLMRIVTGQLRGHSGEVSVYGLATPDPKALSFIGCAPQPISLYPSLTAWENLRFFGVMAGLSKDQIAQRSEWALEKLVLRVFRVDRGVFPAACRDDSGGGAPSFPEAPAPGLTFSGCRSAEPEPYVRFAGGAQRGGRHDFALHAHHGIGPAPVLWPYAAGPRRADL